MPPNHASSVELDLVDEAATEALGARLAAAAPRAAVVALTGDLGMGKTTLVRGFLHALGHAGPVKSPTYTLVEPYELETSVRHFDLYRLGDPEELEYLGVREDFDGGAICLVEWPERGSGWLSIPDLTLALGPGRGGSGRLCRLSAGTPAGKKWLATLDS